MNQSEPPSDQQDKPLQRPGFLSVIQSVLAAFFGVQSEAKREQDFKKGHAADYILVGIIATAVFVLGIVWLVSSLVNDYNAA